MRGKRDCDDQDSVCNEAPLAGELCDAYFTRWFIMWKSIRAKRLDIVAVMHTDLKQKKHVKIVNVNNKPSL